MREEEYGLVKETECEVQDQNGKWRERKDRGRREGEGRKRAKGRSSVGQREGGREEGRWIKTNTEQHTQAETQTYRHTQTRGEAGLHPLPDREVGCWQGVSTILTGKCTPPSSLVESQPPAAALRTFINSLSYLYIQYGFNQDRLLPGP